MKKIFAVGMSALILAGACTFAACGDKKVAVDLRGKEYTFSSAETWSYCIQYASGDPDTPIDNPEQWLADNWNLLSDESDKVDFETGEQRTPAQLIERYKGIMFNGNMGFLKGATVTISETSRTEGERCYCTATVVLDGQTIAEKEVRVEYNEYHKGYTEGVNTDGPDDRVRFEIVDFDAKTGEINEVFAEIVKPLSNGNSFFYQNNLSIAINLKSAEFFCIRCEYKLASVTALT